MLYIYIVRAFGDPLFLKQTYGKGYHVNLVVNRENIEEAQRLVTQALPSSQLVINTNSGEILVTVPKGDIRGLPRLFQWLESSARAVSVVKEWGVSNTTLEQVFLMLCVQNKEINYNANSLTENEVMQQKICPICHVFMKETVFMRNIGGQVMLLPESVCSSCAVGNAGVHYYVDEAEAIALQALPERAERMSAMLAAAQTKLEAAATQQLLANEAKENDELFNENWKNNADLMIEDTPLLHSSTLQSHQLSSPAPVGASMNTNDDPYANSAHGTWVNQVLISGWIY